MGWEVPSLAGFVENTAVVEGKGVGVEEVWPGGERELWTPLACALVAVQHQGQLRLIYLHVYRDAALLSTGSPAQPAPSFS